MDTGTPVAYPGTLRRHMQALHPGKLARSGADLKRQHARAHHRYHLDHFHEFDNAGELAGPNTDRRTPSGWYSGDHAVMRPRRIALAAQACDASGTHAR